MEIPWKARGSSGHSETHPPHLQAQPDKAVREGLRHQGQREGQPMTHGTGGSEGLQGLLVQVLVLAVTLPWKDRGAWASL